MFRFRRRVRRRGTTVTKHYLEHKEKARELLLARLSYFNEHYGFEWNRVAVRNQRRCWGSCSSLKNLNFNYKILFLPPHLQDYIVVHEMCHLVELNHGVRFWQLVEQTMPEYARHRAELRAIDKLGHSVKVLTVVRDRYQSYAIAPMTPLSGVVTRYQPSCESCARSEVCNCSFGRDSA